MQFVTIRKDDRAKICTQRTRSTARTCVEFPAQPRLCRPLGHAMRTKIKIVAGLAVALAIFVFAVFVESSIRNRYAGPMSINGLPINNASVTGMWMQDFLWADKAWKIAVQSDDGLELRLDGSVYIIPKGSREIYSNHDHTNTGQFGSQEFCGYTNEIEVRKIDKMP